MDTGRETLTLLGRAVGQALPTVQEVHRVGDNLQRRVCRTTRKQAEHVPGVEGLQVHYRLKKLPTINSLSTPRVSKFASTSMSSSLST